MEKQVELELELVELTKTYLEQKEKRVDEFRKKQSTSSETIVLRDNLRRYDYFWSKP